MIIRVKNIFKIFSMLMIMISVFNVSKTMALETDTHRNINEYIAQNNLSGFSLDSYLKNQLGMQDGKDTFINNKNVLKWIGDGGVYEDKPSGCVPYWRSRNHFHNPIDNSGFSGWWNTGIISGISVINWTNQPINTQSCGYYSWNDARKYYYTALKATDKTTRETNFAETFRALGQSMHLIQDMSVPEHTRNDGHYFTYDYEVWAKDLKVSDYIPKLFTPNTSFSLSINNLFDTNQYNGANPNITTQAAIGLSEYCNANFLSSEHILTGFDYPTYVGLTAEIETDQTTGKRKVYLNKTGNGENITYLARANSFFNYLPVDYKRYALTLNDEKVYNNYAQLLIPRAIGYSTQVLQYFFRGQMEVKCLPVIEENKIIYVELDVKNTTLDEAMTNGKLMLTGKYLDSNNEEKLVRASYWTPSDGRLYEHAGIPLLNSGQLLKTIHFWFTEENEIPVDKWDSIKLTLTYQGKLGNEEGAVIGKVFSPGKLKFNEEWNNGLSGNHNWFHLADNYKDPDCANITGYNTSSQSGTLLVKDNSGASGSSSGSCGTHFNETTIFKERDTAFPIPITPNTSLQFKIPQMTTNALNPSWDYEGNWQIMALWFADGQNTYVFMISLGDQFFYSPDPDVFYFTFDPAFMMIDNFQDMFQLYGVNSLPNNLQLIQIDFVQKANNDMTLPGQQKMIVDFVRVIEKGDTELVQTP